MSSIISIVLVQIIVPLMKINVLDLSIRETPMVMRGIIQVAVPSTAIEIRLLHILCNGGKDSELSGSSCPKGF